jgi:hypothetical protein
MAYGGISLNNLTLPCGGKMRWKGPVGNKLWYDLVR